MLNNINDFIKTFIVFVWTLLLVPFLGLSYISVTIIHSVWFVIISLLYPELEFLKNTTFRTLVDTHRNQGIITILIKIRGQPEINGIKRHIQELVNRKDKCGNLSFPRLRNCLVTRCGTYAWQKIINTFDLEQNIIIASNNYKGRPINDANIQDYASEVVMKYLPVGVPPWQIVVIPTAENHHYLLFKLHHVLLNDKLNVADLLPLIPPTRTNNVDVKERKTPLIDVIEKSQSVPYLRDKLTEEFTNRWNEFISYYDPLERTELLKNNPGFFEYVAILIITTVAIAKETRKGFKMIRNDPLSKIKYVYMTTMKETDKRQLTFVNFFVSIYVTLNPCNLITTFVKCCWYSLIGLTLRLPLQIYYELMAIFSCIVLKYSAYPNTFVGNLYNYVPLFVYAFAELFACFKRFYYTPITITRELLIKKRINFETITLCGRKVVSWSSPIKMCKIREIAKRTKVTETEIIFSVMSAAFYKYFTQVDYNRPDELPILSRNINSNYLFLTGNRVKSTNSINGMLCVNLPIIDRDTDLIENLLVIKNNFEIAREEQTYTYLLSIMQTKYGIFSKLLPSTFIGIVLKYLSKKYAVSFTEITARHPNVKYTTIWGQDVENVIYWRPPQANNCTYNPNNHEEYTRSPNTT